MSLELAEFIGIHLGDGGIHVRGSSYKITYCFNQKEEALISRTKYLFTTLFSINLKFGQSRNGAITLYCTSKPISLFLNQNYLIPFGRKNQLTIPEIIKSDNTLIKSFLKGLHWTDGCVFIKQDKGKYNYPIIKITTKCENFAKEIQQELIKLSFRATINQKQRNFAGYDVVLHGKEQYERWILEISNKKRIKMGILGLS